MDRILRRDEVLSLVGMKTSWLYAAMAEGKFPKPVKITSRNVGWRESDLREWIQNLEQA